MNINSSNDFFAQVIDSIIDPLHIIDKNFNIIFMNKAFCNWAQSLGFSNVEINKSVFDVFPFLPPGVKIEYNQVFNDKKPLITKEWQTVSGQRFYTETTKSPIYNFENSVENIITIIKDITFQVNAQNEILEIKEKFEKVVESSFLLTTITDIYGKVEFASSQCYEVIGWQKEEIIGVSMPDFIHPEDKERVLTERAKSLKRIPIKEFEYRILDSEGNIRWISHSVNYINMDSGMKIVSTIANITEKKSLQEQLIHSEKLSAVGELSAGIAHEFNNIMTIIHLNAQIMEMKEETKTLELYKHIKAINASIARGKSIVSNMMSFAKPHSPKKRLQNLCLILDDIFKLQEKQFELENIKVIHICNKKNINSYQVYIDKIQIEQVLLNMIINSRHAIIPKGQGNIEIGCYNENNNICFYIKDDGTGIPSDKIKDIFTPFFSTKGAYAQDNYGIQGTGLGLSICYMIIKNHEGKIEVESEYGKWTKFTIKLPIIKIDGENMLEQSAKNVMEDSSNELKVMIIDDENEILNALQMMLENINCIVEFSNSSYSGIEMVKKNHYDLLLLDMLLPDISGEKVFQEIRKFNSNIPIVFISGQTGLEKEKLKNLGAFDFL